MHWIHTTVVIIAHSYLTLRITEYDPCNASMLYPQIISDLYTDINPIEHSQDILTVMAAYSFARKIQNNDLLIYYRDLLLLVRIYLYESTFQQSEEVHHYTFHRHASFAKHLHFGC